MQLTATPATASRAKSDAMWNLLGSLVYAGCQWLVLVATVRLSSAADVGRISLAFALTAPIFLLLQLRLRAASATDATLAYSYRQYAALRIVCTLIALTATLALCFAIHLKHDELVIVVWVALAKAVESGSDLTYGMLQQRHNLRVVALSMMARGVLSIAAFYGLLRSTGSLSTALAGLFAAWAVVFIFIDLPFALRSAPTPTKLIGGGIWKLAWITLPLGLSTMFMSLSANIPRYFIQHTMGAAALGIFSACAYLTMTGNVVISAIAESSIARMAQYFAAGQIAEAVNILRRVRNLTLVLSLSLVFLSLVAGRSALTHLYRAEYAGSAALLVVMMLAAAAANMASVYGYALIAARQFNGYLLCLALSAAVTASACAFTVPRWSTMGAATGCLIGFIFQYVMSMQLLSRELSPGAKVASAPLSFSVAEPVLKS